MGKKKAFVKDREGVSQHFHPSMHGMVLKTRWLHFPCFHMSELLFIDMSMFVFTSVVPLTGCWSYGQGDIGQGMHIGQSGNRESGQVPAAFG
jgi:hypothetical protein